MKSVPIVISMILGAVVLMTSFNNCGQNGSISAISSDEKFDVFVDETLNNCAQADLVGKIQTLNQAIEFKDSRIESGKNQICNFAPTGQTTANGDLDMKEGQLRARYEQSQKLNLPANAVICDVRMTNSLSSFRYDDVFFFKFNNYILATNDKTAVNQRLAPVSRFTYQGQSADLFAYDWNLLRTAPFKNIVDDYCVGKDQGLSQCSWPVSEQAGSIKFEFNPALLIRMSAQIPSQDQTFSFAITGDNDPNLDCYHEKLMFSMTVKYYVRASGI